MSTFMSKETFAKLSEVQQRLAREMEPSDVFVPWAGKNLSEERGIYFVGIAKDAERAGPDQTFEAQLRFAGEMCGQGPNDRGYTPFWRFLDGLTRPLLGGAYHETSDRWGWSNLLKIAYNKGSPGNWPATLKEQQREACVTALTEEFAQLRQSLVFVASRDDYNILDQLLQSSDWSNEFYERAEFCWMKDKSSGNLFIHGKHPSYLQRKNIFDVAVEKTVELTRRILPPFSK